MPLQMRTRAAGEGSPLLPAVRAPPVKPAGGARRLAKWLARAFHFKSEAEAVVVANLVLCGMLANVAFVFGRNAAPAIYLANCGADRLPRAMFLSGVAIIAVTPSTL